MAGNPHKCRSHADRYLRLAKSAICPDESQNFTGLAETWSKLAAEIESDKGLLRMFLELEFSQAYEALPLALKIRA